MSATTRRTQLAPCAQDLFLDHTMQGAHRFLTLAHSRLTIMVVAATPDNERDFQAEGDG
jgi:hypothetical protein